MAGLWTIGAAGQPSSMSTPESPARGAFHRALTPSVVQAYATPLANLWAELSAASGWWQTNQPITAVQWEALITAAGRVYSMLYGEVNWHNDPLVKLVAMAVQNAAHYARDNAVNRDSPPPLGPGLLRPAIFLDSYAQNKIRSIFRLANQV